MKPGPRTAAEMAAWCLPALVFAAGCGQPASTSTPELTPSHAPPSASAVAVAEDLAFTGALSGHLTSGTAGDAYACAATGGAFIAGPLLGTASGAQLEMTITHLGFKGAGSYPPAGVSFDVGADHYYPVSGRPGTLVVAADLRSGTLDIDLAMNTDPNHLVGHVSGTWRCPAD